MSRQEEMNKPDNVVEAEPFKFTTRITQVQLLGRTARNIKDLWLGLKKVPANSIYHHTHKYLEQHGSFSPEYPNDFSFWVTTRLGLRKLGEELASVDIFGFQDIEDLRNRLCEVLENFLMNTRVLRSCIPGEEFHFLCSKIFILPTPCQAANLEQFLAGLEKVTVHSLYFHIFEARMRLKRQDNDFSRWLRNQGYKTLADTISRLDPYTYTVEGLRKKMICLAREEISREKNR